MKDPNKAIQLALNKVRLELRVKKIKPKNFRLVIKVKSKI